MENTDSTDFTDLYDFFNESGYDHTDDDYVKEAPVNLCLKAEVNRFSAEVIPVFYCINFLLSVVGNGLVLCIIYRYEKLSTVTNIFLLNLVLSDLLFASSLPFWAVYHRLDWVFGRALCKLVGSVYSLGFYSSILFLTLMTFDRYLAVVHAVAAAKHRRRVYAGGATAGVWALSLLASTKELLLHDVRENVYYGRLCVETGYSYSTLRHWQLGGYLLQFLLFFLLPLVTVLYCYARITLRVMATRMQEKCRAVKVIFVIVLTFFVCWTPYNVVIVLRALDAAGDERSCSDMLDYALYITRNMAYLYCCISPVLYTFVGKKFQSHFRKLLAARLPCLGIRIISSQSSRSTSCRSPHTLNEY